MKNSAHQISPNLGSISDQHLYWRAPMTLPRARQPWNPEYTRSLRASPTSLFSRIQTLSCSSRHPTLVLLKALRCYTRPLLLWWKPESSTLQNLPTVLNLEPSPRCQSQMLSTIPVSHKRAYLQCLGLAQVATKRITTA